MVGMPQDWIPVFAGMTKGVRKIRSVTRSAQRNQRGARRAGDIRGAECGIGLIPRSRSQTQRVTESLHGGNSAK